MKNRACAWIMGMVLASTLSAGAHHAMEFIETESYTTPMKGEKIIYVRYDYMAPDKDDSSLDRWEWTPGFAFGITDRLMFDIHTHYAQFNIGQIEEDEREQFGDRDPSPFFEAVSVALQYRVTEDWLLDVAVAGQVEIPFRRARDLLDAEEVYEAILILSKPFGAHGNVTLNLIYGIEGSDDHWEFALGVKTPISADPHGIAAGIELLGDIDDIEDSWSVIPGVYMPIGGPYTILKTGVEIGKNADSTAFSISLMHLF